MIEQIKAAVNKILLWRLWAFDLLIVCAVSGGTFYLAGTGDEDWTDMSSAAKSRFWVGMLVVVGTTLRTNIGKALQGLSKGDDIPPDLAGDTQTFTKQTTTQVTQTAQVTTPPGDNPFKAP